jgi:hypothetical protein
MGVEYGDLLTRRCDGRRLRRLPLTGIALGSITGAVEE